MAKEETKKIVPVIEGAVTPANTEISKTGFYTFIKIDADGKEYGEPFEIGAFNARSYLSRPEKFKVKKSPTKA